MARSWKLIWTGLVIAMAGATILVLGVLYFMFNPEQEVISFAGWAWVILGLSGIGLTVMLVGLIDEWREGKKEERLQLMETRSRERH